MSFPGNIRWVILCVSALFRAFTASATSVPPDTVGSAYVERYIPQNAWHGYCLPVDTSLTYPFTNLSISMKWYDEPAHSWQQAGTGGDSALTDRMRGYMLYADAGLSSNSTVGVKGHLNTGDLYFTVTSTPPADGLEGFNLTGNPYPSAVNWYLVGLINVDPVLYVYSSRWRNYVFFNRALNLHTSICSWIIPAMQSFFVHCSAPAPGTGQVIMTNGCRLHSSEGLYKGNPDYPEMMTLSVSGNGYHDEAQLLFTDTATTGFDTRLDALKIFGDPAAPQLFSMTESGVNLALNTRPWATSCTRVDIGFVTGATGVDTLTFAGLETFSDTTEIWLQDKKENQFVYLKEDPDYLFTAAPGDDPARFTIWFCNPFTGTGESHPPAFRIWSFEDCVYADLTSPRNSAYAGSVAVLELTDLAGRTVYRASLVEGMLNRLRPFITSGCYLAKVDRGGQSVVQKLFIR